MARRNLQIYSEVISVLVNGDFKSKDGIISLNDIENVFKAISDKNRPDTIKRHINTMVDLNLLVKKGEVSYAVSDDWFAEIKKYM
jgi:hypothetical protein